MSVLPLICLLYCQISGLALTEKVKIKVVFCRLRLYKVKIFYKYNRNKEKQPSKYNKLNEEVHLKHTCSHASFLHHEGRSQQSPEQFWGDSQSYSRGWECSSKSRQHYQVSKRWLTYKQHIRQSRAYKRLSISCSLFIKEIEEWLFGLPYSGAQK